MGENKKISEKDLTIDQEILHHGRYCIELLRHYNDRPEFVSKVCQRLVLLSFKIFYS